MRWRNIAKRFKDFFSVVNDHKVRQFLIKGLQLHVRYIGFLSNSKLGGRLYGIVLLLYFFAPFKDYLPSNILGFAIFYTVTTATLLIFSVKFPPLKRKMLALLGEAFILKHLGNPGRKPLNSII